ncbi:protein kinase domain-containing protein [Gordonia sp. NPDC003425]
MSGSRVNSQFGPYRLDELLGRGGMGEVYRAYDTVKDREVALKLLNPGLADDAVYQERFRRESHAAARLGEPHVIPIHDWGEIDGVLYIDMRLVSGVDLRAVLRAEDELSPERAVGIIEQVASALDAAHADGLVHRDIKPENILVAQNDFAYLVDFGIAHDAEDTHLTQAGTAIGSIAYMAPELFDAVPVSAASDIYALTCVLYECITGSVPHPSDTVSSAIKAAVMAPAPRPSTVNSDVPASLDAVIRRGLDADPSRRYRTASELAAAARRALAPGVAGEEEVFAENGDDTTHVVTAPPTVIGALPDDEAARATQIRPTPVPPTPIPPSPMPPSPVTPGTLNYSGPQNYSAPQNFSGPQNYSQPQNYSGPQNYSQPQNYAQQPFDQPRPGPVVYPPAYQSGYAPRRDRSLTVPLIGVIAVALVGLVILGAYWLLSGSGSDGKSAAPSSPPVVTQYVQPEPPSAQPAPTPPPGASPCDATVATGTAVTSCPFAQAVRDEYLRTGTKGEARTINAFSPVTGLSYSMSCAPEGGIVTCRGGDNAVVYIY